VRFVAFHLMPWPYLPPDFADVTDSAWVTYPNEHYDPERGRELYERYLTELAACEGLGFDAIAVNEHHQTAYGLMPSPNLVAMALVHRTTSARIAILGNAIPLRDHPMRVVEEVSMLDVMSGGRIICGIVRGLGAEYHTFGLNPVHSQERFFEAHDLMVAAWTRPGPFAWEGKHYQLNYVNPWPRPIQRPHPPIWLPTQGSTSTVRWAAEQRYTLFQTFSALSAVAKSTRQYVEFAAEFGYTPHPEQLGWAVPIYVGKDDDSAMTEFKPHVEYLYHHLRRRPWQATLPPGYVPRAAAAAVAERRRGVGTDRPSAEELAARGEIIVGGPGTVLARLRETIDTSKIGTLATMIQTGTMSHEQTTASVGRLTELVLPKLSGYLPDLPTGKTLVTS
jgi:alkanesulfonate monooxygenase SsuD/methylene tetrahydromethanopterin reductase-like flavin-dependent oxidoreductase (luciferase family)